MAQSKPSLQPSDIWANSANPANKQKPNQSKLDSGWIYGEKPPHNEFNWWWSIVGQQLVHLQQHGTPSWDDLTIYTTGAMAFYVDDIYRWTGGNGVAGAQPTVDPLWIKLPNQTDIDIIDNTIDQLKVVVDSIICSIEILEGKSLLYQESWNSGTGVLQLSTVTIGDIPTSCGDLTN